MSEPRPRNLNNTEEGRRSQAIVIPARIEEKDIAAIREAYRHLQQVIRDLKDYSNSTISAGQIREEIANLRKKVADLKLTEVPVLGARYFDEIETIGRTLNEADKANTGGNRGEALKLIDMAEKQITFLGAIYSAESSIVLRRLPRNVTNPDQAMNDLFDSAEAALLDAGTQNHALGLAIISALNIYLDGYEAYNADHTLARQRRQELWDFINSRGYRRGIDTKTRSKAAYSEKDAEDDRKALNTFRKDSVMLADLLRRMNIDALQAGYKTTSQMITAQTLSTLRDSMDRLRKDTKDLLDRLQDEKKAKDVRSEEIVALDRRYRDVINMPLIETDEEKVSKLRISATELAGTVKTPKEGTAEWFGAQAISALDDHNRDAASLAIAMGFLARSAKGAPNGIRGYLPLDTTVEIQDILTRKLQPTIAMLSRYADQIEVATTKADVDRLLRENPLKGVGLAKESAERIADAAKVARERVEKGDIEGARRILDMVIEYAGLVKKYPGKRWIGSDGMESAIDDERGGKEALQKFNNAMFYYQFSEKTDAIRRSLAEFGKGSEQKGVIERNLLQVEEMARAGKNAQAQQLLTMIVMYEDCVVKLGIRRGNKIESMSPTFNGSSMELAIDALAKEKPQVDGKDVVVTFFSGYQINQKAAVELEAGRIEAFMKGKTAGKETIDGALAVARNRADAGDIGGAWVMIQFVNEFYGMPPQGNRGWRYNMSSRPGEAYKEGRNGMLDAIKLEMNAASEHDHLAAAQLFENATLRIAQADMLEGDLARMRRRYNGDEAFDTKDNATKGSVKIGITPDNKPVYLELARVRDFEKAHPDDPTLKGPTIDQLLKKCEDAAKRGDVTGYNRAIDDIFGHYDEGARAMVGGRFWAVVARAARQKDIETVRSQLKDMEGFLKALPLYGDVPGEADRLSRTEKAYQQLTTGDIDKDEYDRRIAAIQRERKSAVDSGVAVSPLRASLESRRAALLKRLGEVEGGTMALSHGEKESPSILDQYASLMSDVSHERRMSLGMAQIDEELTSNKQYIHSVKGEYGDIRNRTLDRLNASQASLGEAKRALASGNFRLAMDKYMEGMNARADALEIYNADNVMNFAKVSSAHRAAHGIAPDERVFPVIRLQREMRERSLYLSMQQEVFNDLLFGGAPANPKEHAEQMQRRSQGLKLIELSIFAIPSDAASQFIANHGPNQRHLRGSVTEAWRLALSGDFARADREMNTALGYLNQMQKDVEDAKFASKVALISVGVASAFIPAVGPYISGAIFLGMAVEQVTTEYRQDGHAKWTSWGMLGLTVVTLGLAGAGAIFRTMGEGAFAAGNFARYTTLMRVSVAANWSAMGIGIGFSGYMGGQAYRLYMQAKQSTDPRQQEVLMREAMLTGGMALFPIAHMAASKVYSWSVKPTPRAQFEAAVEELAPQRVEPKVEAGEGAMAGLDAQIREPGKLFEFLRRLTSTDPAIRTAARTDLKALPEQTVTSIDALLKHGAVLKALQVGELSPFAEAAVKKAISNFAPETKPTGPKGTRPQWDGAGLLEATGLKDFLRDLLIPDSAIASNPELATAKAAARARLGRLRTESPRIGELLDRLMNGKEYQSLRDDVTSGTLSAKSQMMLRNYEVLIRSSLPDDVVADAQQAEMVYLTAGTGALAAVAVEVPLGEPAPNAVVGIARMPAPRAAGPGGGGGPVVPGVTVGGAGQQPTVTGGGPQQPLNINITMPEKVGLTRSIGRWGVGKLGEWKARRAAAKERPITTSEEARHAFAESGVNAMERETLDFIRNPQEARARLIEKQGIADDAQAELDFLKKTKGSEADIKKAEEAAAKAKADALAAETNLEGMRGADPNAIRTAEGALTRARAESMKAEKALNNLRSTNGSALEIAESEATAADARAEAVAFENNLNNAPARLASQIKAVHARAKAAGAGKGNEGYWDLLRRLYSNYAVNPNIKGVLDGMAANDPALARALTDGGNNTALKAGGMGRVKAYVENPKNRSISDKEWPILAQAIEQQAAVVRYAFEGLRGAQKELADGNGSEAAVLAARKNLLRVLNENGISLRDYLETTQGQALGRIKQLDGAIAGTKRLADAAEKLQAAEGRLKSAKGTAAEVQTAKDELVGLGKEYGIDLKEPLDTAKLLDEWSKLVVSLGSRKATLSAALDKLNATRIDFEAGKANVNSINSAMDNMAKAMRSDKIEIADPLDLGRLNMDIQVGNRTGQLTGLRITNADRAVLALELEGTTVKVGGRSVPVLSGDYIIEQRNAAIGRVNSMLDGMKTSDPVNQAILDELSGKVSSGGNIETALAEALSSKKVIDAVAVKYNSRKVADAYAEVAKSDAFQSAVKAGRFNEALELADSAMRSISKTVTGVSGPPNLAKDIFGFVSDMAEMPELSDSFKEIERLGKSAEKREIETDIEANKRLIANREFGILDGVRRAWNYIRDEGVMRSTGNAIRWVFSKEPGYNWGWRTYGRAVRDSMLDPSAPEAGWQWRYWRAGTRAAGSNFARAAVGAAVWAGYGYGAYRVYKRFREEADKNVDQGLKLAKSRYRIDISRDRALDITLDKYAKPRNPQMRMFWLELEQPPRDPDSVPRDEADLRRMLENPSIVVNPKTLDQLLNEAHDMVDKLPQINDLIRKLNGSDKEAAADAERQLREILEGTPQKQGMGIKLKDLSDLLSKEHRTEVTIVDMKRLRTDSWVEKGLMLRYKDVEALDFCEKNGINDPELTQYAKFLATNTDVFVMLWGAVQSGNIPMSMLGDAIKLVSGDIAKIRSQVTDAKKLDQVLMDSLDAGGVYFKSPIGVNSFLAQLDKRAIDYARSTMPLSSDEKAFLQNFRSIMTQYRSNPDALQRFNQFAISDDEGIYGDISGLAKRISDAKDQSGVNTVLTEARKEGSVIKAILVAVDPRLALPENRELVEFVMANSDGVKAGLLKWVIDDFDTKFNNPRHIAKLKEMLEYMKNTSSIKDWVGKPIKKDEKPEEMRTRIALRIYDPAARGASYITQLEEIFAQDDKKWYKNWVPGKPADIKPVPVVPVRYGRYAAVAARQVPVAPPAEVTIDVKDVEGLFTKYPALGTALDVAVDSKAEASTVKGKKVYTEPMISQWALGINPDATKPQPDESTQDANKENAHKVFRTYIAGKILSAARGNPAEISALAAMGITIVEDPAVKELKQTCDGMGIAFADLVALNRTDIKLSDLQALKAKDPEKADLAKINDLLTKRTQIKPDVATLAISIKQAEVEKVLKIFAHDELQKAPAPKK